MTFQEKLDAIVLKNNSLLCVGLDSDIDRVPKHILSLEHPQTTFNKAIVDATADLVCAFKPNTAFYESRGLPGFEALKRTCDYIRQTYPEIPIILDAKRADIGSTNEGYAKFAFDYLGADAITLHPYLGQEALQPFLDRKDKGCIILCRTSNPGSGELQELEVGGKPLYQIVAEQVVTKWNNNKNCALVVGATYPTELEAVRGIVGNMPLLIPGIGAQGGDIEKTVRAGVDHTGKNAMINASRSIIFASQDQDFDTRARQEAQKLKDTINNFR
jgi:orotidine-5'-phosphate decarboxylase